MKLITYAYLLSVASAAVIPSKKDLNRGKVLKLPFRKTHNDSSSVVTSDGRVLVKRESSREFAITNQKTFYSVDLDIGTPAQSVTVLLDTGSSDLWVTGYNNPYCISGNKESNPINSTIKRSGTIDCDKYGTFNSGLSSSFHRNDTSFSITYGDQSFAKGTWGQDVLSLDGVDISGVSFAVADNTDSNVGVLGIGFEDLETTTGASGYVEDPHTYPNLPVVLKTSGAIDTVAYSLYLDDAAAMEGSILFGGVDQSKYTGTLYTVPIVNIYEGHTKPIALDITLQGVGISSSNSKKTITTSSIPILLDSGTTLTYFPSEYVKLVADAIGATYIASGLYGMTCPSAEDDRELVFDLGGFHITAPLSSFLITSNDDSSICFLGMVVQDSLPAIMGDLFLTHAYVVYDLDNYEVSLAQASYTGAEEDIQAILSDVPNAVKAPGYSNTWNGNQQYNAGGNIFTLADESMGSTATVSGHVTTSSLTTTTQPTVARSSLSSAASQAAAKCNSADFFDNILCLLDSIL
ncbi:hypothetical protein C6P45_002397 [Maudiozyma exigua]|uniref:Peptidase A1 domain-containing protein n=1 Tax=Maudiozyma exigua TaxID=34358 RepID=A0A9P6VWD4_MAUEX|nr:hypothetical protein C6P45_002397 [Kazachstania exigua]